MKKMIALMMAAAMTASLLAGCGSSTAETEKADTEAASTTEAAETEAESADTEEGGRLQEILDRGVLTVATEPYFAPDEFIDPSLPEDEQIVGSDIELAKYIADKLGVELEIVPLEFGAVLSGVAEGKYDLAISGLGYTPARAEAMILSEGYYYPEEDNGYGLLIREEDLGVINGPEDLADKVIVAQSGSLQELFMTNEVTEYKEFKKTSSTNDAALSVQEGKADAASVAIDWAELYIEQNEGCGLVVVPDFQFEAGPEYSSMRIGMPLGATDLEEEINAIIEEVLESGIYVEWYEEYSEYAKELGL